MTPGADLKLRPAVLTDQRAIANLMHFSQQVHRHLDWRNPLDWIGTSPYYVLENDHGELTAVLGCPPDPPRVAWVRLFANAGKIPVQDSWKILFERVRADLTGKGKVMVAAIVLQEWSEGLFRSSEFSSRQSIVMLERNGGLPAEADLLAETAIRAMMPYDLPAVAQVDASAFELLWQNSLPALEHAYPQAMIATLYSATGSSLLVDWDADCAARSDVQRL